MYQPPVVLAVSASDSSGHSGLQADLATLAALGVHGVSVVSAITAQNSLSVDHIEQVSSRSIRAQFRCLLSDFSFDAVKIGMLGSADTVRLVADLLRTADTGCPIVIDPIVSSSTGKELADSSTLEALIEHLFPLASLLTPNRPEARRILHTATGNVPHTPESLVEELARLGGPVLLTGGHAESSTHCRDLLWDGTLRVFSGSRLHTADTRGTGCTLSAAVAGHLARGKGLVEAVSRARDFVRHTLRESYRIGAGPGPAGRLTRQPRRDDSGTRSCRSPAASTEGQPPEDPE